MVLEGDARALRSVIGLADVRKAVLAWGLSVVGETAALVALLVVAYDAGGAPFVAALVVLRAIPSVLVGPALIGGSDRGRRERWLFWVMVVRAALVVSAGLASWTGSGLLAMVLGGAASMLFMTHRPMNGALLPSLCRTPAELTSANATCAFAESAGTLVGPSLAGLLLLVSSPALVLGVSAGLIGAGAVAVAAIRPVPALGAGVEPFTLRSAAGGLGQGLAAMRSPALLLVLVGAQTFARGVLLVAVVVLAVDEFGQGDSGVGWLSAMVGVGGLVGSVLAASWLTARRLSRGFIVGVVLWGLPMVAMAVWTTPLVGIVAFGVIGIGNALVDVGGFTLIARIVPRELLGRAFAAFEVLIIVSVTAGSWVGSVLIEQSGVRATLAVAGGALVVGGLTFAWQAKRVDQALEPSEHVEMLRRCDVLAPLPLVSIEHLAAVGDQRRYADGDVVIRVGEPGDSFHVVIDGAAVVRVNDVDVRRLDVGDGFGEIALLRDVPRTATVIADGPLRTLAITRSDFLTFVAGHPASAAAAAHLAQARLETGPRLT